MIVMKFGGSSVAGAIRIRHVAGIIQEFAKDDHIVVVVSAMEGVTDKLINVFQRYRSGDTKNASEELMLLREMHMNAASDFGLSEKAHKTLHHCLDDLFTQLQQHLSGCKQFSESDYAYTVSFGERFSSCLLAAVLEYIGVGAVSVDASDVIVATGTPLDGKVDISLTQKNVLKMLSPLISQKTVPVVTGFFAANQDGEVMTLGRGGSDYSATVLANALDAKEVILWKEVDGVFTEDPKKVASAKFYPRLSYQEALDLAQKGAKILHPEAMKPVADKNIVVWVKNTFKPYQEGTKIWKEA